MQEGCARLENYIKNHAEHKTTSEIRQDEEQRQSLEQAEMSAKIRVPQVIDKKNLNGNARGAAKYPVSPPLQPREVTKAVAPKIVPKKTYVNPPVIDSLRVQRTQMDSPLKSLLKSETILANIMKTFERDSMFADPKDGAMFKQHVSEYFNFHPADAQYISKKINSTSWQNKNSAQKRAYIESWTSYKKPNLTPNAKGGHIGLIPEFGNSAFAAVVDREMEKIAFRRMNAPQRVAQRMTGGRLILRVG